MLLLWVGNDCAKMNSNYATNQKLINSIYFKTNQNQTNKKKTVRANRISNWKKIGNDQTKIIPNEKTNEMLLKNSSETKMQSWMGVKWKLQNSNANVNLKKKKNRFNWCNGETKPKIYEMVRLCQFDKKWLMLFVLFFLFFVSKFFAISTNHVCLSLWEFFPCHRLCFSLVQRNLPIEKLREK